MTKSKQVTFLASLGAGLEYYDFIVYSLMAESISLLFFPEESAVIGQIKAFGIFAVGYLTRTLGGLFFGMIGDTFGRKQTFLGVMFLMAFSTLGIGLLPTYQSVGIAAPILLLILRVIQGLSYGAELPGAITVVCEHSKRKNYSLASSIVISSVGAGSLLASLVLFILNKSLSTQLILEGGWRLPFLLGGGLALVNLMIRKQLTESPEFLKSSHIIEQSNVFKPLDLLWTCHRRDVIRGCLKTLPLAYSVIFFLYMPTLLKLESDLQSSEIFLAMTLALIGSALILPLCGKFVDKKEPSKIYLIACLSFAAGLGLFNNFFSLNFWTLLLFMFFYQGMIALLSASYFPLMVDLFPTSSRYTGLALCYNFTYSIVGCLPIGLSFFRETPYFSNLGVGGLIVCLMVSGWMSYTERVSTFDFGQRETL